MKSYEQKYKEALDWMQSLYSGLHGATKEDAEHYFPELKEDNDERIRKGLIKAVSGILKGNTLYGTDVTREEALAWLEKQGEKKLTDKVEPKFHEGDFIVNDYCSGKVIEITNDAYLLDTGQGIPFSCEHNAHLWTLKDAKDGDVLVCKGNIKDSNGIKYERICLFNSLGNDFFTLTKTSNYVEEYDIDVNIDYPDNTIPATKEQKEILFMAMKEAGYEWDADKKELKKIEPKKLDADNCKSFF